MVVVPAPATEGLKLPEVTPVPEYVPPAGDPPERVTGEEVVQTAVSAPCVTVGFVFTT